MSVFSGENLACERGERLVFRDLTFRLADGGALVLIGPNGSGKSSLLRLMAGLSSALSGRIVWDGEDVATDREAHGARLQFLGHGDAVKPVLTVAENLRLWSDLRQPPAQSARHRRQALEAFGLGRLADVPGRYLSAGQRRRLALARLLAAPSRLWLLDEPRTALDRDAADALDAAIVRHREQGGMVVVALHGGPYPEATEVLDLAHHAVARAC